MGFDEIFTTSAVSGAGLSEAMQRMSREIIDKIPKAADQKPHLELVRLAEPVQHTDTAARKGCC